MARQVGEYRFEGTVDGICFYKMEGEYYARKVSSLTGKRFRKAACFEGSRRSCERLSRGSQLAAIVYTRFRKQQGMYAALKSKAIWLLKKNTSEEKVIRKLLKLASVLQPVRRHSYRYLRPLWIIRQEPKNLAPVFYIPSLSERISFFNRYLSSGQRYTRRKALAFFAYSLRSLRYLIMLINVK
jgi:hypothetical protein